MRPDSVVMLEQFTAAIANQLVLSEVVAIRREGGDFGSCVIMDLLTSRAQELSGVANRARDEYAAEGGLMRDDLYFLVCTTAILNQASKIMDLLLMRIEAAIEKEEGCV